MGSTPPEPRHGNLFAFVLNNPLIYIDPDGREVVQLGKSLPKMVQTREAFQEIVGSVGTVRADYIENVGWKFRLEQTADQARASAGNTAVNDLQGAFNSNERINIINVDSTRSNTARERADDRATAAAREIDKHGGAVTRRPANPNLPTEVVIDYTDASGRTTAAFDGSETDFTPGIVLGHEVIGHAHKKLDETEARRYENRHLRPPQGKKLRDTHNSAPPRQRSRGINDKEDTKPVVPFGCGIECVRAF
jgi:hypothetical protein